MRTHTAIAATTAALAIALAGCSTSDKGTDDTPSKVKATASSESVPDASSSFLQPTAAQQEKLIAGLKAVDPGLTVNEDRAVRRSVNVCDDIRHGKDHTSVVHNAALRYDGGDASVDDAKAEKIVKVITDTYCKS